MRLRMLANSDYCRGRAWHYYVGARADKVKKGPPIPPHPGQSLAQPDAWPAAPAKGETLNNSISLYRIWTATESLARAMAAVKLRDVAPVLI